MKYRCIFFLFLGLWFLYLPADEGALTNEDVCAAGENEHADDQILFGDEGQAEGEPLFFACLNTFELRFGGQYFIDDNARQAYKSVIPDMEWQWRRFWDSRLAFYLHGIYNPAKSSGFSTGSRLRLYSLAVGSEFFFPLDCSSAFFLGAGILGSYGDIRFENPGFPHYHKFQVGLELKSGYIRFFHKQYFASLFCDYSYQPLFFSSDWTYIGQKADVGGLRFGLGLGKAF